MRRLESHDDAARAQGLSDYLEVQGIENLVRSFDDRHEVWIVDEADLERGKELASEFAGVTSGADGASARKIRAQREVDAKPVRAPAFAMGGGASGASSPGPATLGLIIASVAVTVLSGMGDRSSELVRALLVVPISIDGYFTPAIAWSQPWRLLTPMFIHFGLMHLAFNMIWLYRFGSQIESLQGVAVLLGLVALTQVPGVVIQFAWTGPMFGGMSGVVYGLFGYCWMQARYASKGFGVSDQDTMWIMGWFVVCATGLVGHIANAQHALGLIFGLLAGMPAYVAYRRSGSSVAFKEGSWADENIRGFPRFKRLYVTPYVPLWFVGLAIVVLLTD